MEGGKKGKEDRNLATRRPSVSYYLDKLFE